MTPARVGIVLLLGVSVARGVVQGTHLPDVVASKWLAPERWAQTAARLAGDLDDFGLATTAFVGWWTVRIVRRHRLPA
jgi:hypothetical protein